MNFHHLHAIIRKEMQGYFNSPSGILFMAAFLLVSFWFFFRDFFVVNEVTMRPFFELMPWIFLLLVPAITMRLWAEERKMGTQEALLTAPVTFGEVVMGKFLASFLFLFINLLLTGILPLMLWGIGNPDWGVIAGGYLGTLLLGAAYLSIGFFASSLTESHITAFIIGVFLIFLFFIMGHETFLAMLPPWLAPWLLYASLQGHFESLARGVIDSRDLVYYGSVLFLFLYLNAATLHRHKWR